MPSARLIVAINLHLHRIAPWRQELAAREERFPPLLELPQGMMSANAVLLAALDVVPVAVAGG